ncbi:MAG TPA: hypothetical protein VI895_02860 [Bdellovibrionota bacterium]|nr:hypothetical protein [Bdellovibrionota bacterium]
MKFFALLVLGTALTVGSALAADPAKKAETKAKTTTTTTAATTATWTDQANVTKHVKEHLTFTATGMTKAEILKVCNNMTDISENDKKLFAQKLPEGTYKSAEEVIKAVGL